MASRTVAQTQPQPVNNEKEPCGNAVNAKDNKQKKRQEIHIEPRSDSGKYARQYAGHGRRRHPAMNAPRLRFTVCAMRMLIAIFVVLFTAPLALSQGFAQGDSNRVANCQVEIGDAVPYTWYCMVTDHADPLTGEPRGFTLNGVPNFSSVTVRFPRHGEPLASDWSGNPPGRYGPANIGVLFEDEGCWLGEDVRICVSEPEPNEFFGPPPRLVDCLIDVDAIVRADGPCLLYGDPIPSPDGDDRFSLTEVYGGTNASVHFPAHDQPATATWGGGPVDPHEPADLGILVEDGKCWVGDAARICVYE